MTITVPIRARMICSSCGIEAGCDCHAPYVEPGERAKAAVLANPEKSDRAIAEKIGVGPNTVRRARTAPSGAVEPVARIGRDGKTRRLPTSKPPEPTPEPEPGPEPECEFIKFRRELHERVNADKQIQEIIKQWRQFEEHLNALPAGKIKAFWQYVGLPNL